MRIIDGIQHYTIEEMAYKFRMGKGKMRNIIYRADAIRVLIRKVKSFRGKPTAYLPFSAIDIIMKYTTGTCEICRNPIPFHHKGKRYCDTCKDKVMKPRWVADARDREREKLRKMRQAVA